MSAARLAVGGIWLVVVCIASTTLAPRAAMAQTPAPTVNLGGPAGPADPSHPGKALYDKHCAACHDHPQETKSVPFESLRGMRHGTLHYTLTRGKMKLQASTMNEKQLGTLLDYLVGRKITDDSWIGRMRCPADRRAVDLKPPASVAGFGFDQRNTRALTREQAGLATADFRDLTLAWAIAFPQAVTMRAQPAVVGNTLFLPVGEDARLFAFDVSTSRPCIKWVYTSDLPLRSSAGYGELPGSRRKVLVFNDVATRIHMVDAATGKLLWKTTVGLTDLSNTTGTPVIYGDKVFVPISASEINIGGDDRHLCCKTHGAFTALDAKTGRKVWTTHTMEDAKPIRDRGDGQMMWGPSGAPIWNSPLLDVKRGLIYVGTGEATSAPAAPTTDAILALDMKTGKIRWQYQTTADDIFLTACMRRPEGLNCPHEGKLLDHDFGATFVLAQRSDGRDIILAGQKSGTLWALDPDANGKLVWSRSFGKGSPVGGIHWGLAYDGKQVFAPIHSFPGPDGIDPNQTPGLHAVRVDDGEVLWSYETTADCSGDRTKRVPNCKSIGMTGAPTIIDGVVLEGSADGYLRAFDRLTGEVLFSYDTARSYETVNGVPGHGGGIDNASIVATNGYVFLNSGYGLMGGEGAGNVFLAFRRKAAGP
jgi:polyvinyl alcohol dehydrogenase (cytochrome)